MAVMNGQRASGTGTPDQQVRGSADRRTEGTYPAPPGMSIDSTSPLPRGRLLGSAALLTCKGSVSIYRIAGLGSLNAVVTKDGTVFIGKRGRIPSVLLSSNTR
jgi:hypothetical protein